MGANITINDKNFMSLKTMKIFKDAMCKNILKLITCACYVLHGIVQFLRKTQYVYLLIMGFFLLNLNSTQGKIDNEGLKFSIKLLK